MRGLGGGMCAQQGVCGRGACVARGPVRILLECILVTIQIYSMCWEVLTDDSTTPIFKTSQPSPCSFAMLETAASLL